MANVKAIFGSNVRYYRKKQRLTQEQLAEKLEISTKHLSTIETGTNFVSADLLEKMAQQLFVSASALFYTAEEVSADDSYFGQIDRIIDDEFSKFSSAIKTQVRHLHCKPE
ncbi:MAG: helix-turn-helix domain-containing protein [Treponema sp.]|nr:helix-turn-helix domain-containing protein [Treponema sp.]